MAGNPGKMLAANELSAFCTQIAMVLKAGVSVDEGISIMLEDMKNAEGKEILSSIHEKIELGETLHDALASSEKFPKYMLDMVQVGEESGKLDEVMDSLSSYYDREENIARSIKSAVTYPLIMIVMMVLVIVVLMVKVLPIFNQVFIQLGSEMSAFSRSVMNFGSVIGKYSVAIVVVLALLIAGFLVLRGTAAGRRTLARFQASFILTRGLFSRIASGRFASAMSMMLSAGLDTDRALDMVEKLVDNEPLSEKITACRGQIAEGVSFSDALVQAGIFTGMNARMVSVGFKTGSADQVMHRLADQYEEEVDAKISSIISVLEPTLVAVLSVIVGMILLSVMLPLMGIMSSIG